MFAAARGDRPDVIALLLDLGLPLDTTEPPPPRQDLGRLENLARIILIAHESGDPAALQAVQEPFGRMFTWDELRADLRQRRTAILGTDPGTSYVNVATLRTHFLRARSIAK
jgi:hypothetical protein